jgi:hypothetical protein
MRSNVEHGVTGGLRFGLNLIGWIDEGHVLVDVDFPIFVGVHLSKHVFDLLISDLGIPAFDHKLFELLHV